MEHWNQKFGLYASICGNRKIPKIIQYVPLTCQTSLVVARIWRVWCKSVGLASFGLLLSPHVPATYSQQALLESFCCSRLSLPFGVFGLRGHANCTKNRFLRKVLGTTAKVHQIWNKRNVTASHFLLTVGLYTLYSAKAHMKILLSARFKAVRNNEYR